MGSFLVPGSGKRGVGLALTAIPLAVSLFAGDNQWTPVGPEGGLVASLTADPNAPSTVYATTCGGVFKSTDGGASWALSLNSGLPPEYCLAPYPLNPEIGFGSSLAIDPHHAGTVYAAASGAIFKTTNGGADWNVLSGPSRPCCFQLLLAIDSGNPATLYAWTVGPAISKTTDGGTSWTRISGFNLGALLAVDPQNPGTIYAAGNTGGPSDGGLYKSVDGGMSWNLIGSGLPPNISVLIVDPHTQGALYAGGAGQIFKSTDGGASWSTIFTALPVSNESAIVSPIVQSMAVSPQTSAVIYALISLNLLNPPSYSFSLATSSDGGATWTTSADPILAANDLLTIMPDLQDAGTLYLGTTSGVLKTTDAGGHWNFSNSGLRATSIGQVVIDPRNGALFAANTTVSYASQDPRLFRSTDRGETWVATGVGLPSFFRGIVVDPQNPSTLYTTGTHSGGGNGLFKSEDAGNSWTEIWFLAAGSTGLGPLAINPQNPSILYVGVTSCIGSCFPRVGVSTDGGYLWDLPSVGLQGTSCCSAISSVTVDPQNPNTIYAGTGDDNGTGSGLWKSVDGGATWTNLLFGDIDALLLDQRNPSIIYVDSGYYVLQKSTDGGQTWADANFGACYLLAIDPRRSNTLYATGCYNDPNYFKVFRSADGGANWTAVGSSGPPGGVSLLTIDPQDPNTLYAPTPVGLFAITLDGQSAPKRGPLHR